tara:strand:+ start:511 stop:864 length:354 start_codon:yes stop_codon:yes gene_type:complete
MRDFENLFTLGGRMEYEYDEDAGTLAIDQYAVALLIMLSERFGAGVAIDESTVATCQYWCEDVLPQLLSQVYESHQWESSEETGAWVEKMMARAIAPVVCVSNGQIRQTPKTGTALQ